MKRTLKTLLLSASVAIFSSGYLASANAGDMDAEAASLLEATRRNGVTAARGATGNLAVMLRGAWVVSLFIKK